MVNRLCGATGPQTPGRAVPVEDPEIPVPSTGYDRRERPEIKLPESEPLVLCELELPMGI